MKKNISILLIALCILAISTLTLFAEEAKYDFRETNWGMSREQVKATENLDEELFPLTLFTAIKEYKPDTIHTIRIETFSKEEDAQNLAKQIGDIGYQTYVIKGETLYEVQVGEFKSYKEAKSFSDKMEKDKGLRKIIDPPGRFNVLRYQDYIRGFDCSIYYWFLEDKLYQSAYWLNENILHEAPCIEDYAELKELLIKKYGKPTIYEEKWVDDLAKRNELNRETAINKGCLEYRTGWETPTTKIFMALSGHKNKTYLGITYLSKELEGWVEEIRAENRQLKEKIILEDF